MIWSNNNKISLEMLRGINTSSKLSLKMSCLIISDGNIEKAEKMYEYFAKDMQLPDTDPVKPSSFQQFKDTAETIFGTIKENKDDILSAINFIQELRSGRPAVPPTAPVDIPPLPNE